MLCFALAPVMKCPGTSAQWGTALGLQARYSLEKQQQPGLFLLLSPGLFLSPSSRSVPVQAQHRAGTCTAALRACAGTELLHPSEPCIAGAAGACVPRTRGPGSQGTTEQVCASLAGAMDTVQPPQPSSLPHTEHSSVLALMTDPPTQHPRADGDPPLAPHALRPSTLHPQTGPPHTCTAPEAPISTLFTHPHSLLLHTVWAETALEGLPGEGDHAREFASQGGARGGGNRQGLWGAGPRQGAEQIGLHGQVREGLGCRTQLGFGHSWSAGTGWGAGWVRPGCALHPVLTGCTGPSCGHHRQLRKGDSPLRTCTHSGTTCLSPCSHLWVFLGIGGAPLDQVKGAATTWSCGPARACHFHGPAPSSSQPKSILPSSLYPGPASRKGCKAPAFPTPLLGFCRPVQTGGGSMGS